MGRTGKKGVGIGYWIFVMIIVMGTILYNSIWRRSLLQEERRTDFVCSRGIGCSRIQIAAGEQGA